MMKQKYMNMDMMKDEMKVMNNQNHRKKDLMMIFALLDLIDDRWKMFIIFIYIFRYIQIN
jgi:hypothetical protein